MELVYLWVDKYKNIENEGFNFSPRFTCSYDKDTQKLTIDEKKEHVSIFPDNINVTAIVGENGSGKSSILELVLLNNFHPSITLTNQPQYFCLYYSNELFYIKNINTKIQICNYKLNNFNDEIFIIHYDNSFSKIDYYNNISNSTNNIYLFPIKEEKFNSHKYNEELKNILLSMKKGFTNSDLYNFFYPNQIFIDLNNSIQNDIENFDTYSKYMKNYVYQCYQHFERESNINYILKIPKVKMNFENWGKVIEQAKNNVIKEPLTQKMMLDEFFQFDYLLENFDSFMELFNLSSDEILNPIENAHSYFKDVTKRKRIFEQRKKWVIDKSVLNKKAIEILINLPNSIQLEIYDTVKNISLKELSNGEKALLHIRLYFGRTIFKHLNKEFIILIDEAETDLHPQWQKQVVKYFIDSFKEYKIHFILTSHSPFILSDLPKENVIFLKKDKDGNCKNVTKETNIDTFGANIHTLLSHGFFMDGGLMGEFAKDKINKIIEFHKKIEQQKEDKAKIEELKNEYEKKKKKFWHIQSIVGEEYLKQVIRNHLVEIEKLLLGKDEAKKAEIMRLQKQIELLESKDA